MTVEHSIGGALEEGIASVLGDIRRLPMNDRIRTIRERTISEDRYVSIEQAMIITDSYRKTEGQPRVLRRARALARSLEEMTIRIDPEEIIVGNRTAGIRAGVVFPEAGVGWIDEEIDTIATRPQDRFNVRPEDIVTFRRAVLPYWKGKGLRDEVEREVGSEVRDIERVVKINQKDHAQGHICPNATAWLKMGPAGLADKTRAKLDAETEKGKRDFYEAVLIVLDASRTFMRRYAVLAREKAKNPDIPVHGGDLLAVSGVCGRLADSPPETFHEAIQSVWFLYAILQMESNASSFSPGRLDQILLPYFLHDIEAGRIDLEGALELIEALWLKFNQVVYLRNSHSARYFAGFPVGINVAVGGQIADGVDGTNVLSFLMLKAQEHIGLSQPNFSARLWEGTPREFLVECARVIGLGSGMPQIFNDESIVPALQNQGIPHDEAVNYAVVGCVELTTHGNMLGWSDAAMFNMVKALELAVNDGVCLISGTQMGPKTGTLTDFETFEALERAYRIQLDHFIDRMITVSRTVDRIHARVLPSPFLSSVIDDCIERGIDVTAGGARYNYAGIQAIQVANVADSLAAYKALYDDPMAEREVLLRALRANFEGDELLRLRLLNKIPKYGNDVEWVDELGLKWVEYFARKMGDFENVRGGPYHTGLYTVSAHVPMGKNVGATPDGRKAGEPLADGGMSAVYGRDQNGPTALLHSVSRIDARLGSNGTLLNMKFLPEFFASDEDIGKFASLLRTFVRLRINHVQFNVIRPDDLVAAQKEPEKYRSMTVRVAGYTAYFTELAGDLQDEIIARTTYGAV